MRNFLCCVDGSRHSESGLRHGANLAARCAGRVEILHVASDKADGEDELFEGPSPLAVETPAEAPEELPSPGEDIERPERMLGRMVDICRSAEVGWTLSTLVGGPAQRILQRSHISDMLTMGRQGEAAEGSGVGRVTRRVIARADRPVLVATGTFTEPATLLVPYVRSREDGRALRLAAEVATHLDAGVVVLSAGRDALKTANALTEAEEYLRSYRLETEFVHRKDALEESLPTVRSERECELVVMGAPGAGRFGNWLFGSSATALLTAIRCPAILCP